MALRGTKGLPTTASSKTLSSFRPVPKSVVSNQAYQSEMDHALALHARLKKLRVEAANTKAEFDNVLEKLLNERGPEIQELLLLEGSTMSSGVGGA